MLPRAAAAGGFLFCSQDDKTFQGVDEVPVWAEVEILTEDPTPNAMLDIKADRE